MTRLNTEPRLEDPDAVYGRLVALYEGLDDAQCALVANRLILLLANHIGDTAVVVQAISAARPAGSPISTEGHERGPPPR